jgi:hypothetical protein
VTASDFLNASDRRIAIRADALVRSLLNDKSRENAAATAAFKDEWERQRQDCLLWLDQTAALQSSANAAATPGDLQFGQQGGSTDSKSVSGAGTSTVGGGSGSSRRRSSPASASAAAAAAATTSYNEVLRSLEYPVVRTSGTRGLGICMGSLTLSFFDALPKKNSQ